MTETNDPYVRYTRALDEQDAADNVALRLAVENADRVPMMPRGGLYRVTIERIPEPEEEPRWMTWGRNRIGDQWADTDDCDVAMAFGEAGVMNWCRLWGTSADRDAKRERLQAVAREVGKP